MITLDRVSYSYHKKGVPALSEVSAQIGEGIHLMLGENGAGKTTLLHVMAGLLFPRAGRCLIDTVPVSSRRPEVMEQVFFLAEDMRLGAKTVREFARIHAPFYPTFSAKVLDGCLAAFGLSGDEKLKNLSLGNRKKSNIAYAMSLQTPILLLDEPANGLDIESKKALQQIFATYVRPDQTVVVSTHTVWDLKNLFDGVIVLNRSHLVLAKPLSQIVERVAFVTSLEEPQDALYKEMEVSGWHGIVPNEGNGDSDIDFTLLYSALRSEKGNEIINLINQQS